MGRAALQLVLTLTERREIVRKPAARVRAKRHREAARCRAVELAADGWSLAEIKPVPPAARPCSVGCTSSALAARVSSARVAVARRPAAQRPSAPARRARASPPRPSRERESATAGTRRREVDAHQVEGLRGTSLGHLVLDRPRGGSRVTQRRVPRSASPIARMRHDSRAPTSRADTRAAVGSRRTRKSHEEDHTAPPSRGRRAPQSGDTLPREMGHRDRVSLQGPIAHAHDERPPLRPVGPPTLDQPHVQLVDAPARASRARPHFHQARSTQ